MDELLDLAEKIKTCEQCKLRKECRGSTSWNGNPQSPLMIIGEGPGEIEDQYGVPLVGPSGKLLDRALKSVNIARHLVYVTNIIKCRPKYNRTPTLEEANFCASRWLEKEISIIKPKVIIALGSVALHYLYNEKTGIVKTRGTWLTSKHNIPLMPTFHPAYILRQTGENLKKVKWQVFYDLQAAKEKCSELAPDYKFSDDTWPNIADFYTEQREARMKK